MKIILATDSFLKKYVMDQSKLKYEIDPADIDEHVFDDLSIAERVQKLSYEKCKKNAEKHLDDIVIAADTLVSSENKVLGKPTNIDDAYKMALSLSGKKIEAFTGITLKSVNHDFVTELSRTIVKYQKFEQNELERLFKDNFPTRIASSLGVFTDAPGFTLVESFNGSYTGALGLPMEILYKYLRKWQYKDIQS